MKPNDGSDSGDVVENFGYPPLKSVDIATVMSSINPIITRIMTMRSHAASLLLVNLIAFLGFVFTRMKLIKRKRFKATDPTDYLLGHKQPKIQYF